MALPCEEEDVDESAPTATVRPLEDEKARQKLDDDVDANMSMVVMEIILICGFLACFLCAWLWGPIGESSIYLLFDFFGLMGRGIVCVAPPAKMNNDLCLLFGRIAWWHRIYCVFDPIYQ
mmetsp:Transcript_668/g.1525  ORF Transcript_668/g.1525 Transcript_668/m.1525 type:complete len:120 (+) Transcript_668:3087-3446(+)